MSDDQSDKTGKGRPKGLFSLFEVFGACQPKVVTEVIDGDLYVGYEGGGLVSCAVDVSTRGYHRKPIDFGKVVGGGTVDPVF